MSQGRQIVEATGEDVWRLGWQQMMLPRHCRLRLRFSRTIGRVISQKEHEVMTGNCRLSGMVQVIHAKSRSSLQKQLLI